MKQMYNPIQTLLLGLPVGAGLLLSHPVAWVAGASDPGPVQIPVESGADGYRVAAQIIRTIGEPNGLPGTFGLLAISPDNQKIATGIQLLETTPYADAVRVWNLETGTPLYTLTGHPASISAIAFSPDGRFLATADYNHDQRMMTIRLWDAATGQPVHRMMRAVAPQYRQGGYYHRAVLAFSPDGQVLYSSATNPLIQAWDVQTGRLTRSLVGHRSTVRAIAVSPTGETLATTHVDGTVTLLNAATQQIVRTLTGGTDAFEVAFSPEGERVIATFTQAQYHPRQRQIAAWEVNTGRLVHTVSGFPEADWISISPDATRFATANYQDREIQFYRLSSGALEETVTVQSTHVSFAPNGQVFAAVTDDGVQIWR